MILLDVRGVGLVGIMIVLVMFIVLSSMVLSVGGVLMMI